MKPVVLAIAEEKKEVNNMGEDEFWTYQNDREDDIYRLKLESEKLKQDYWRLKIQQLKEGK